MSTRWNIPGVTVALVMLATAAAFAQPERSARSDGRSAQDDRGVVGTTHEEHRASELIGQTIRTRTDRFVIDDLVLDIDNAHVEYLVAREHISGTTLAVPPSFVRVGPRDHLIFDLSREQMDNIPRLQNGRYPAHMWDTGTRYAFEGRLERSQSARASDVLGATVVDPNGRRLGRLDDIVLDLVDGSVRHAVLTGWRGGRWSVDLDRFSIERDGLLSLPVEADAFTRVHPPAEAWPANAERPRRGARWSDATDDDVSWYEDDDRYEDDPRDRRRDESVHRDWYDDDGSADYEYDPSRNADVTRNRFGYDARRAVAPVSPRDDVRGAEQSSGWDDDTGRRFDEFDIYGDSHGDDSSRGFDDRRDRFEGWSARDDRARDHRSTFGEREGGSLDRDDTWSRPEDAEHLATGRPDAAAARVNGTVVAITESANRFGDAHKQLHVTVRTDGGRRHVLHFGPKATFDRRGIDIRRGDRLMAAGTSTHMDGDPVVLVDRVMLADGRTLRLNGNHR